MDKIPGKVLQALTDHQLVQWARRFGGWTYFHMNDQLRDPRGGMTTANNWNDIGPYRRAEIIKQMAESATEDQLKELG
jgi:hypothetical protein